MKNNYKIQNKGLSGKIENIRRYFEEDHFYSSVCAAGTLVCGAGGYWSIMEFINELNGVVPMDPDSPMIIPAVGLPIAAFGLLAGFIWNRIKEDQELRAKYARQLELIELKKQKRKMEQQRIEDHHTSTFNMAMNNPYVDVQKDSEDNHKTI